MPDRGTWESGKWWANGCRKTISNTFKRGEVQAIKQGQMDTKFIFPNTLSHYEIVEQFGMKWVGDLAVMIYLERRLLSILIHLRHASAVYNGRYYVLWHH